MRVTRGYAHADRRTRHMMMIMTRGSAEVCKRAIGKGRSKSNRNNFFIELIFFLFKVRRTLR